MCNMLAAGSQGEEASWTCTSLYSRYDAHKLSFICGVKRAGQMLHSNKSVHLFVTGAEDKTSWSLKLVQQLVSPQVPDQGHLCSQNGYQDIKYSMFSLGMTWYNFSMSSTVTATWSITEGSAGTSFRAMKIKTKNMLFFLGKISRTKLATTQI